MIENWIDALAEVWAEVEDGNGGNVRSYHLFDRAEFPESISEFPCAISYPTGVLCEYSAGNSIEVWEGRTEFHLTASSGKHLMPSVLRFFARIRNAAALHMTLGGLVDYFMLRQEESSIQGPVKISYGSEEPHWGLIVSWVVKENVSNQVVIE